MTWAEFIRLVADRIKANAPPGEDIKGWNYQGPMTTDSSEMCAF
jgi:hypothetical protein